MFNNLRTRIKYGDNYMAQNKVYRKDRKVCIKSVIDDTCSGWPSKVAGVEVMLRLRSSSVSVSYTTG